MTTRTATEADVEVLARLTGQLGYPSEGGQIQDRLSSVGGRDDHAVFVAELGGKLVGWVHVFTSHRLEADSFAEIGGLVVDSTARRRGAGSALVRAAEEWSRRRGFHSIRVRSNVIRADAHEFYSQRGYTESKQQAVFDKDLRHD